MRVRVVAAMAAAARAVATARAVAAAAVVVAAVASAVVAAVVVVAVSAWAHLQPELAPLARLEAARELVVRGEIGELRVRGEQRRADAPAQRQPAHPRPQRASASSERRADVVVVGGGGVLRVLVALEAGGGCAVE
ncbi:MAG: hypothetical protein VXW27_09830 [Pseudomonadota bacterium]|nr:hypothetical protein [Pseudomonadota bacterium]